MSSSIWTRCGGAEALRSLRCDAWRMVEAQHRVATLKLVDDLEEQALLEEMIDGVKPTPPFPERRGLHYLLSTPFRYPPLRRGSRFGARFDVGIWYGALRERTVLAEVAYYRLLFLEDSAAELAPLETEHTSFRARIVTEAGVDLTAPPFDAYRSRLASRTSYAATQPLGRAMREAGVEAFLFASARDPEGGTNAAVLDPAAFARRTPLSPTRTWHCLATKERVVLSRRGALSEERAAFLRQDFEVRGKLARVS